MCELRDTSAHGQWVLVSRHSEIMMASQTHLQFGAIDDEITKGGT